MLVVNLFGYSNFWDISLALLVVFDEDQGSNALDVVSKCNFVQSTLPQFTWIYVNEYILYAVIEAWLNARS